MNQKTVVWWKKMQTKMIWKKSLTLLLSTSLAKCVLAQHADHQNGVTDPKVDLAVLVDGAKTPEKIPDDLAYRHFFAAIAESVPLSEQTERRQRTHLTPVQLSSIDYMVLTTRLGELKNALERIAFSRSYLSAPSGSTGDADSDRLKSEEGAALDAAVRDVKARLTRDGLNRLGTYLNEFVKRRIVIYGSPSGAN